MDTRATTALGRLIGALLLLTAPLAAPASPATALLEVPSGHDLFATDPTTTVANVQLPAGFFGPGSDPFNGDVMFAGEPLQTFGGHDVGDASTVVQRAEPAEPMPTDTVPIEIVALSLISVEPITVTYGGANPEDWDVQVGLSSSGPSEGQVVITQTSPQGGTFEAQLQVVPLFTFTRLSDGSTRTLDGAELPPGGFNLTAGGVPWRAGCILPALAVPGLNDGFCPSFTPEGQLQPTVFTAAFVHHGVYPAQPASEHFKCYRLEKADFKARSVTLADQFGSRSAKVTARNELCNPVQKNDEPFLNTQAHLVCYATTGPDEGTLVAVRNQFGSQRLLVGEPRQLCVPSQKRAGKTPFDVIDVPIDHVQCYAVKAETPLRRFGALGEVELRDQFGRERVAVRSPVQLCAPVQKNDELIIQHPLHHLVCYAIRDERVEKQVVVRNQFEKKKVRTVRPVRLCVPSDKLVLE